MKQLLRLSKKKFKGHRDFWLQASRALVYFDDADREPNPKLLDSTDWSTLKRFFEKEVLKIIENHVH